MESQLVSIIIPTFNNDQFIQNMIESLTNQTYTNWEGIFVDDGSFDRTIEMIIKLSNIEKRIKLFKRPATKVKGANSCRNYGFHKSKGKYIQWFDSDDLMHPGFLELKIQELKKNHSDFVVCKGIIFKDKIENKIGAWDKLTGEKPVIDQALGQINFQTNAPMFRRDFLEGKKLWNEKLQRKQDYEFFNRILSHSTSYKIVDAYLFSYRQHSKSINGVNSSTTIRSMIRADLLVYSNTVQTIKAKNEKLKFQQHFFRKIISRSKTAVRNKYYFTYLQGLLGALSIINLNYLSNYLQRK